MFIEDTINIRHIISNYLSLLSGYDYIRNPIRIITEFVIYFLIGGLMVYPLWKYFKFLNLGQRTRTYLITGYLAYAVGSISSASRYLFNWYDRLGEAIIDLLPVTEAAGWALASSNLEKAGWYPLGFWLIDFLVEESIELIGAGFLLAFLLAYLGNLRTTQNSVRIKRYGP